jgi:signal transduction histidine kinase/Tfp pilus assembly protein PilF
MFKIRLILFLFFLHFRTFGQDYASVDFYLIDSLDLSAISSKDRALIDSSLTSYHSCNDDICRLQAVGEIVEDSWDINVWPRYNRWIYDFTSAQLTRDNLDSATFTNLRISYASALNNIGYLFNATDQADSALYYYDKCLLIQEEMGDKPGMAGTLINTGYIFLNQGLIEKALEYYYRSLAIEEEIGNQSGIATALNGIGYMQYKLGDTEAALKSYNQSLVIRRERSDDYGTATCLNNIGLVFKDQGRWDKALNYFEECMKLEEKLADENGVAISLSNIGFVYNGMGQWNKALTQYRQSLEIMKRLDDKSGIASALNSIADVELTKGNVNTARARAQESLKIAREIKFPEAIRDAAETLHKVEKKVNDWEKALSYYELYIQMRDSVFNQENVTASIHRQYKYRYERQALADSIEIANEQQIQAAMLSASEAETERLSALAAKQKQQAYFLVFGVFSALLFSATVLNRMKTIKRQKATITAQNEELKLQKKNLSNFAHTVSHDLKTPIGGIIGLIDLVELENPELGGELKESLDLIRKSAMDSNELIMGVLAYSEAGKLTKETEQVDISDLLKTILDELPNEQQVSVDLQGPFPTLTTNKLQLKQVFTNLIKNAIKYNDRPRGDGLVTVTAETGTDLHHFTVADNGPGIAPRLHKRAFELFGKTHSGQYAFSSGIGLSIVKTLVEQNGGTISLESDIGQGAQFTFTWPKKA